jgi:hypothetical protein
MSVLIGGEINVRNNIYGYLESVWLLDTGFILYNCAKCKPFLFDIHTNMRCLVCQGATIQNNSKVLSDWTYTFISLMFPFKAMCFLT